MTANYGSIQIDQGTDDMFDGKEEYEYSAIKSSRNRKHVKYIAVAAIFLTALLLYNTTINADWINSISSASSTFLPTMSFWPFLRVRPSKTLKRSFTGTYSDPNHVNCLRQILHVGHHVYVYGTDGNPDCPPDGSGDPWELSGKIEGKHIYVDFSPKGGPKDLDGVWEKYPVPGIRWLDDGNLWALTSNEVDFGD